MTKIILHIDLNAFFVRCEEILNPSLEGKAVIIGHEGRAGIVSTCSYKAREYGVRSGMPTFKAKQLCPHAIIIDESHFKVYKEFSRKFFTFLTQYSRIIEKASIDECFVDMTAQLAKVKDPIKYLTDMQQRLFRETGLKCSIGVAPTKFLAKMASDMKKPMGITIIRRRDVRKMLDPLPIGDFFGIGKKTAPKLEAMGIKTIGDLAKLINSDDEIIKQKLGKFYYVIKDWINGYGDDIVDVEPFDPKSVGHSTTLIMNTSNYDDLKDTIVKVAKEVANDAKEIDKVGYSVQIVLKDTEFKTRNKSRKLEKPTNSFEVISSTALSLLDQVYNEEKEIRLVGVTLQQLVNPSEAIIQTSIFDDFEEIQKEHSTKLLIGELNRKFNKKAFKTAREDLDDKKYGD